MEAIILFVLFSVGSLILQAVKQNGNRQNQPASPAKPIKPTMQPNVAPHRSPGNQNTNKVQSNKPQPNTGSVTKPVQEVFKSLDPEGVQTEGPISSTPKQSKKIDVEPVKESSIMDMDYDDLQRSIIMSEVLGKPKALRKN